MHSFIHELLLTGIAAAKAGDMLEARSYLERVVSRVDATIDEKSDAWYYLSEISSNAEEQRACLENILASNLGDVRARRKLAILNGELNPEQIINPDRVKQTVPSSQKAANWQRFDCPQCGGRMTYTPDGQSLVCEFCETAERMEEKAKGGPSKDEENFLAALATSKGHFKPLSTRLFTCQSCGALFFLPAKQMTLTCPYCTSIFILDQAEKEDTIEPNSLIRFEISLEKATQILESWLTDHKIKIDDEIKPLSGVYLPAWAFDVGGMMSWTCLVERTSKDGWSWDKPGRSADWVIEKGERIILYENLLIPASKRLPGDASGKILAGFDLKKLEAYDARHLVDRAAEYYQLPLAEASLLARKETLERERKGILHELNTEVRDLNLSTANMVIEGYRLVLLPAWFAHYRVKNQEFTCVVNGQSGVIWGEKPQHGLLKWLDKVIP